MNILEIIGLAALLVSILGAILWSAGILRVDLTREE